jgi:hypothetical protein
LINFLIALQAVYPEHKEIWKDVLLQRGYWQDIVHQRKFFDQLAIKLQIQKPEDWYNVHWKTVVNEGGSFVARYYNASLVQGTKVYNICLQ